uniref:Uncharacterized protein n=1 Tax=viral metagenome TaxID=1070528 RepID=A0A6M3J362_9ZZZZ
MLTSDPFGFDPFEEDTQPQQSGADFLGQWYTDIPGSSVSGGMPSTKQEEGFILDFISQNQRAPTQQEAAAFMKGVPGSEYQWRPESTMGQMGFRTQQDYLDAQRAGEPYGPYAGSLVPEGGTVLSKDMSPWLRTYQPERYGGPIGRGEYFTPPGGLKGAPPSLFGEPTGKNMAEFYPQYDRSPFQEPSMEEVLGKHAPTQVYQARLADYLDRQIEQDKPEAQKWTDYYNTEIQGFKDRLALGKIDQAAYNEGSIALRNMIDEKLSGLMTEDRATELAQQAMDLINKGTQAEELPLFADIQGVTGASVQDLYNQTVKGTPVLDYYGNQKLDRAGNPMFTGGLEAQFNQEQAKIPQFKGYPDVGAVNPVTGREQGQYLSYVESLGLAPEYANYMKGRYWGFYNLWLQARRQADYPMPFISFINDYLAGGG